ncbi:hypothetical protein Hdeb2414_s0007g00252911 [Helianthus debilis subsp. tardiflorus]
MASRTRSRSNEPVPTIVSQNLIREPEKEICSFNNADIAALKGSGAFPVGAVIRPFDREVRSDTSSDEWVCFFTYPFSLGLRYPFPPFISRFFELTGLSYVQTMPMVWRVLMVLDQIKSRHCPDLCIKDLPIAYRLRSHGNSHFLLFSTSKNPLILKATKNEYQWQRKFFFVKRDSIDEGFDLPVRWLTNANFRDLAPPSAESQPRIKEVYRLPATERTFSLSLTNSSQKSSSEMYVPIINLEGFQLDELDSYSSLAPIKQEINPKPADTPKPSSSKTATTPKAPPTSKTRASSSRKRKEADHPTTPHVFPFENHGFTDSSKFMTCFLNQGLERLVFLYEDACGSNVMLENKLKKAEATIADQAAIATAKSEHYEAKYKAMTQDHQSAIQKITQEAQAKSNVAQVQHEQDMASYRESLKNSVIISLIQARLKMAYEARALGVECPSWNIKAWEMKLKDLGGNLVEPPSKPAAEEPAKVTEKVDDAGASKDAGGDAADEVGMNA